MRSRIGRRGDEGAAVDLALAAIDDSATTAGSLIQITSHMAERKVAGILANLRQLPPDRRLPWRKQRHARQWQEVVDRMIGYGM